MKQEIAATNESQKARGNKAKKKKIKNEKKNSLS
jgi:hypothetical protein